ncbi:MAG TPA: hypothetical protein VLM42_20570 [Bryobacteraceae bacterium]|nr:hypothetical protein [Bryobacteraceae bacterium]
MSRVEQIERAIQELSPEEFAQLAQYIRSLEQERWERQLDNEAASGKLDFLQNEVRKERESGTLKAWPPEQ